MEIKFLQNYRGQFAKGQVLEVDNVVAQIYIDRKIACKLATKPNKDKVKRRTR